MNRIEKLGITESTGRQAWDQFPHWKPKQTLIDGSYGRRKPHTVPEVAEDSEAPGFYESASDNPEGGETEGRPARPEGDGKDFLYGYGRESVLYDIPFTPQAPLAQWDDPRQEDGCEEASVLMAVYWLRGQGLTPLTARREIIAAAEYQKKEYGTFKDIVGYLKMVVLDGQGANIVEIIDKKEIEMMGGFQGTLGVILEIGVLIVHPEQPARASYHLFGVSMLDSCAEGLPTAL